MILFLCVTLDIFAGTKFLGNLKTFKTVAFKRVSNQCIASPTCLLMTYKIEYLGILKIPIDLGPLIC